MGAAMVGANILQQRIEVWLTGNHSWRARMTQWEQGTSANAKISATMPC